VWEPALYKLSAETIVSSLQFSAETMVNEMFLESFAQTRTIRRLRCNGRPLAGGDDFDCLGSRLIKSTIA
jgi:hypothetical protein